VKGRAESGIRLALVLHPFELGFSNCACSFMAVEPQISGIVLWLCPVLNITANWVVWPGGWCIYLTSRLLPLEHIAVATMHASKVLPISTAYSWGQYHRDLGHSIWTSPQCRSRMDFIHGGTSYCDLGFTPVRCTACCSWIAAMRCSRRSPSTLSSGDFTVLLGESFLAG
jgi:hypothetical protein